MIDTFMNENVTISNVRYAEITVQSDVGPQPADVLLVELENGKSFNITNGDFTVANYALQFMAYCNTKPSTMEEDLIGYTIPVVQKEDGVFPPDYVFTHGQDRLQQTDWGPSIFE